jgi:hypothetical protein
MKRVNMEGIAIMVRLAGEVLDDYGFAYYDDLFLCGQ